MATLAPVTILGRHGFIGRELRKRELPSGIYYFGSPSSNILFDEDLDGCLRETIDGFLTLLARCRRTGEYLVYASSATVFNKNTSYARCKAILEELHFAYGENVQALGLQIAAGYGPGEAHKGRYASVIYQWCKQMAIGERPVVYGNGSQTRDFIYIDDVADTIARLAHEHLTGLVPVGTGINTSFLEIIALINETLGTHLEPRFVGRPAQYVNETRVAPVPCRVSLAEGIRRVCASVVKLEVI